MLYFVKQIKNTFQAFLLSSLDSFGKGISETPEQNPEQITGKARKDGIQLSENLENQTGYTTKEQLPEDQMTGTFGELLDIQTIKNNINTASFKKMIYSLNKGDFKNLYKKSLDLANKNNLELDGDKKNHYFSPFNIGELKKLFRNAGYKAKGFFGGEEMGSLFTLVENIHLTQNKIPNLNFKDKIGILFDYNVDGILDDDVHFYTKEKQIFEEIDEKKFNNLIINLGYNSIKEFNEKFSDNYYKAREEFKNKLGKILSVERVLNPGEMLSNPNAIKEFNIEKKQVEEGVDEVFSKHEKVKKLPPETQRLLKVEAIGLLLGSHLGFGMSFDIKELTNNIIDSLGFGIIDGIPGIGISRKLFESKNSKFKIDGGIINLIPLVGISGVIKESEIGKIKELFPEEFDSSTKITLMGGLSPLGTTIGIDFSKDHSESKNGIEKAKIKMSKILDNVFEEIEEGKTFEQSSFNNENSNKEIYERLTGLYESNGGKEYVQYLKEGALKNYERVLYENAGDGIKFTGGGLGLLFISGYFPIPLVFIHGEKHTTIWNEVPTYAKIKEINPVEEITETTEVKEYIKGGIDKIKNLEELNNILKEIGEGINKNTRYNGGDVILNPHASLGDRWQGLIKMAKLGEKYKNKTNDNKYEGIGHLGNTPLLSLLNNNNDSNDIMKLYIISTITQDMKKANDFDSGDITSWNNKTDKFIAIDQKRRKNYDGLFGFSLDKEAIDYNYQLKNNKGAIGETKLMGIGFDATSTIIDTKGKKAVKGIDTLYANLSILTKNGEPLLIPITNPEKIKAFIKKIPELKISDDIKQSLIDGINAGEIELNYYKDPEGFDDRILPIIKKTITTTTTVPRKVDENSDNNITVFQPHSSTMIVGATGIGKKISNDSDGDSSPKKSSTSTPLEETGATGQGGTSGGNNTGNTGNTSGRD